MSTGHSSRSRSSSRATARPSPGSSTARCGRGPRAGTASVAVGVPVDPALAERAEALLHAAGHWGFAQFQFIAGDGDPCLIDVNVGMPGSLPLALASGVNLPAAWHAVVAGGDSSSEPRPYRPGVTYRWLEADLYAARRGDRRALLRRAPRPRVGAVWAADDPLPGLIYSAQLARRGVRR